MRRSAETAKWVVAAVAATLLGGCAPDAVCRSAEYPVQQTGGTGRQCVARGQQPPPGWARYPAGREPRHVDDEWDVYWRTHAVDTDGTVIEIR